jgi:hypothetical protein
MVYMSVTENQQNYVQKKFCLKGVFIWAITGQASMVFFVFDKDSSRLNSLAQF